MLLCTVGGQKALHLLNQLIDINIFTIHPHIQNIKKYLLYLAKPYISVEFGLVKRAFEIIASKWDHGLWKESTLKEKLGNNEMKKVRFFPANLQDKKREKGVPVVVTYRPIPNS